MRPTEAKNSPQSQIVRWLQHESSLFSCAYSYRHSRHQQTKDKHILHSMLLKESEIELFYTADIQIITTTVQVSVSLQMTLGVE